MIRTIHRAKYVLAEADLLLSDAAVSVSDPGRISRVEPWHGPPCSLEAEVVDWGSAVIVPGLVNAHTHLELTRLAGRLTRFESFADWIGQLVAARRSWSRDDYLESARAGARCALASGTTLVGDISASGVSREALAREPLRKVVFEEVLGLLPESAAESLRALAERLDRVTPDELLCSGVSPHAPYSVSPELFRAAADVARRRGLPLAVHTAETEGELEFLRSGRGELRALVDRLGALPEGWEPPGVSPVVYFEMLGILDRPAVLAHCNYLDEDSMARICKSRSSVVYCPRSHAFFGHGPHPVRQLLDLGANVALGTDSLASNQSLSMIDEMRFLAGRRRDLRPEEIFRMATLNGAAALGFGGVLGRLRRGYWADMAVLEIPENLAARNLAAQVLEGAGECVATIVRGATAWRRS
jgi:cytosine/adenosine deaminase-related metal-dependent hydrolase